MSFEAKRLRVQLPCDAARSLVEGANRPHTVCAVAGSLRPTLCWFPSDPNCPWGSDPGCVRFASRRCHDFLTNCGFPSPPIGCPPATDPCGPGSWVAVEPDPEDPATVLLHPDDLPQFRRQLEAELNQIEALAQRKEEIEGQLGEIDSAQEELKKQAEEQ